MKGSRDMSMMLKEIHQQPEALARMFDKESDNAGKIAARAREMNPAFFCLVARGSSDNAALYGKYLFEGRLGIPSSLAAPSVSTVYKKQIDFSRGVVIGISQSGEAPDIVEVLSSAKKSGAYTVGITNTEGSPIAKAADDVLFLRAGREKGLAATKTYTTQLLAMMMIAAFFSNDKKMIRAIQSLPESIEKAFTLEDRIRTMSERYRYMQQCVIIGRGYDYCTVKEAALKFMETCYVVAQPFSTADFMHGPIAVAGDGFPTFVSVPSGKMSARLTELCSQLQEKNLETIVISPLKKALRTATMAVELPASVIEAVSPAVSIVPFQYFACFLSRARGLDPDHPRFLSKVTRTL